MLTENEVLRQRYEAREKARRDALWVENDRRRQRDEAQALHEEAQALREEAQTLREEAQTLREEAQAQIGEVREESLREGLRKGETIGRIHLCQRLLKQPASSMQELDALGLDELEALATQLESRLPG